MLEGEKKNNKKIILCKYWYWAEGVVGMTVAALLKEAWASFKKNAAAAGGGFAQPQEPKAFLEESRSWKQVQRKKWLWCTWS